MLIPALHTVQMPTDVSHALIQKFQPHVWPATVVTHKNFDVLGKGIPKHLAKDASDLEQFVSMVNPGGSVDPGKDVHRSARDPLDHRLASKTVPLQKIRVKPWSHWIFYRPVACLHMVNLWWCSQDNSISNGQEIHIGRHGRQMIISLHLLLILI
jgi:hypothetical protein